MAIIFLSIIAIFVIYLIKGSDKIDYYIKAVLSNKSAYMNSVKSLNNITSRIVKSNILNAAKAKKKTINNKNSSIDKLLSNGKSQLRIFRKSKKKKKKPLEKGVAPPIKKIKRKKNKKVNDSSYKDIIKTNEKSNKSGLSSINNIIQINYINCKKSKKKKKNQKETNNLNETFNQKNDLNNILNNDANLFHIKKK